MSTIPDGYADCSVKLSLTGLPRPSFITFGVKNESDVLADNLATQVATALTFTGSIAKTLAGAVQMVDVTVRVGTGAAEPVIGYHAIGVQGGGASAPPSANVAVLVNKLTARGGRRGRGRMFIPWFVNEANVDGAGVIGGAGLTEAQGSVNIFFQQLALHSAPLVLLHSPGKTTEGPPDTVTALSVSNLVATQRKRLGR